VTRVAAIGVALLALLVALPPAAGQPARPGAALVLETGGTPAPAFRPYTEIPAGTTISLAGGARVVFVHYRTCRTVTVVGGTVTVTAEAYAPAGGAAATETPAPCPRPVTLTRGGEVVVGGFLTRSIGPALTLAPRPSFVLAGPRSGDFTAVRVSQEGREVLTVPLTGAGLHWPAGAPALTVSTVYDLVLLPASPEAPLTLRFRVAAPEAVGEALTVISVE
jgi:hypothetical protein